MSDWRKYRLPQRGTRTEPKPHIKLYPGARAKDGTVVSWRLVLSSHFLNSLESGDRISILINDDARLIGLKLGQREDYALRQYPGGKVTTIRIRSADVAWLKGGTVFLERDPVTMAWAGRQP